jgi:battenin
LIFFRFFVFIFKFLRLASIASSLGEITFLSMSTLYSRNLSLGSWSSGTGAAGLIGAFSYAAITSAGVSPSNTILIMLCMPVIMSISYILLPSVSFVQTKIKKSMTIIDGTLTIDSVQEDKSLTNRLSKTSLTNSNSTFKEKAVNKLSLVRPLLKYMVPLFLVYFAEYFINQGMFELLYFKNDFIKQHEEQYRYIRFKFIL